MTDREKLIEVMTEYYGVDPAYYDVDAPSIADHLIANGVTVQKWIPVAERLPEKDGCYIVTACDEGCQYGEGIWYDTVVVLAEYYDDGRWVWYEGIAEYDLCEIVTHWMPLPEPPKGETT